MQCWLTSGLVRRRHRGAIFCCHSQAKNSYKRCMCTSVCVNCAHNPDAVSMDMTAGRSDLARASYERMLRHFSSKWIMDAPLPNFGQDTWAHDPVMLTIDAFGCAAAILRGSFAYV